MNQQTLVLLERFSFPSHEYVNIKSRSIFVVVKKVVFRIAIIEEGPSIFFLTC